MTSVGEYIRKRARGMSVRRVAFPLEKMKGAIIDFLNSKEPSPSVSPVVCLVRVGS